MTSVAPRNDRGFTLVEMVIVVTLMGLVLAVIAATFVAILRITPATQFRIDDARSTRGLQTRLARDLASTPDANVVTSPGYSSPGCGGGSGENVLHLSWVDGSTFTVDYRIVDQRIIRTYCDGSSTASNELTSAVAPTPCTEPPWPGNVYAIVNTITVNQLDSPTPKNYKEVDLCLVSLEEDTGLNGGGGTTQEILISVTSRHPDSVS